MAKHKAVLGRFYEDFVVGDSYEHPFGRTISETDCTWFTQLTCNTNQNHFNAHLALSNPVSNGKIIVNSGLTVAIILGISVIDMSQNAVAGFATTVEESATSADTLAAAAAFVASITEMARA